MKKRIITIYQKWIHLKPLYFILVTTFLVLIMEMLIIALFELINLTNNEYGGVNFDKYGVLLIIFSGIFASPILETLTAQYIPILLTQKFIKYYPNLIGMIMSTLIFSCLHLTYSIWYAIAVIPGGLILAKTFIIFQKRNESSFWMTSFLHSFRNLIALILILIDR